MNGKAVAMADLAIAVTNPMTYASQRNEVTALSDSMR